MSHFTKLIKTKGNAIKCEAAPGENGGHAGLIVLVEDDRDRTILGHTDSTFPTAKAAVDAMKAAVEAVRNGVRVPEVEEVLPDNIPSKVPCSATEKEVEKKPKKKPRKRKRKKKGAGDPVFKSAEEAIAPVEGVVKTVRSSEPIFKAADEAKPKKKSSRKKGEDS